ncbi:MAG: 5-formyltetrahydrofolate cyclo-ligase [Acinetobacter sp.]|nr:5-formyltetrahydrofolate cyclo-ligase [Acinetobacter sp.]
MTAITTAQQQMALRKTLRRQRRALSIFQQRQAQIAILRYLWRNRHFHACQHIGVYWADFGEIYTRAIIDYCFKLGKKVYLPQVCAMNQQLQWVQLSRQHLRSQRMVRHRLQMLEVRQSRGHCIQHLDWLFLPLLACDVDGYRLGMGGGFYDRTLAHAKATMYRVGLAHDFQYLQQPFARQAWDQPIHALWTPSKAYYF